MFSWKNWNNMGTWVADRWDFVLTISGRSTPYTFSIDILANTDNYYTVTSSGGGALSFIGSEISSVTKTVLGSSLLGLGIMMIVTSIVIHKKKK
jgi:hypothetical protein